ASRRERCTTSSYRGCSPSSWPANPRSWRRSSSVAPSISRCTMTSPDTNRSAIARVNVLDPEFYVDPWESYRWLRDEAPVYWDPVQKLWAISRYDDVMAVEKNGARYSS